MNLQQLKYVEALASQGSFVAAAQVCNVTQPTLSNGIGQLEDELGLKLFVRTTRKVSLSDSGAQLLPGIRDILNAQKSLVAAVQKLKNPEQQLVRIGVSPLIGLELVNHIVASFRNANPNVEIFFRELNLTEMSRLLETDQLDFVFGPVDLEHKWGAEWNGVEFMTEPLVFLTRDQSRMASNKITLKDIAAEVFVMVPDACGLTRTIRSVFRTNRIKLKEYAGAAMSYRVLQEWSELGIGSAILPISKAKPGTGIEIISGGKKLTITYEVRWRKVAAMPAVKSLGLYFKAVAPSLAKGLQT
jgi:LysR family transcriptional regulator, hydrogen peroxide-inducible genes activator